MLIAAMLFFGETFLHAHAHSSTHTHLHFIISHEIGLTPVLFFNETKKCYLSRLVLNIMKSLIPSPTLKLLLKNIYLNNRLEKLVR